MLTATTAKLDNGLLKQMTLAQLIQQAFQYHSAGRLAEAQSLYRKVLAQKPDHPAVLHLLGTLLHQQGNNVEAAQLVRRAIQLNPKDADAHTNIAAIYRSLGKSDDAIAAGRIATQLAPQSPEAHNNLGLALKMKGEFAEARTELTRAIQLRPGFVDAMMNLGNVLVELGRSEEAVSIQQAAVRARPIGTGFHNLGIALRSAGRLPEAIDAFSRAVQLDSKSAEFLATLGDAFMEAEQYEKAIEAYESALRVQPGLERIFDNLGIAYQELNRSTEAIAAHRRALKSQPDSPSTHFNLAIALLLDGQYIEGWREHEWRWKRQDFSTAPRDFGRPMWDGATDPAGKTILVHAEQGFGDTLQFARYAPLLADRGAKVIVESQPALVRLLRSLHAVGQVIARGDALPDFDMHIPMMSLPLAFGTTLETIPSQVPYLTAKETWRDRLADKGLNVGLVWAGNPNRRQDHVRSMSLANLAPLANVPNVNFYSLQLNQGSEQTSDPPAGMRLIDHTSELHDFADTAALISSLDLIITIDTAAAHLAGALGKPVWVMLPFFAGWRWMIGRTDSPWYPSARLFRQTSRGDWSDVVGAVADALSRYHPTP